MKSERIFKVPEVQNMKEVIYNAVKNYSENIAFVIKHQNGKEVEYENVTYKRFLEDINKLGTALYKLGLKGKRVAVIGKNRYEWALAHISNLLGEIVSVPLDKDLQYDELERSLIRSKADCIIFDEKLTEDITKIKNSEKTNLKEFICMSENKGFKSVPELVKMGEKEIENDSSYVNAEIDNDAMAILLFTSGTTAQSKAVMLSHRNVASNVHDLQSMEDINSTDTSIALLPFHHIFGSTCMAYTLACGVKIVFADGLRYVKQNLVEYKVTIFVGVPLLIESIYKAVVKEIEKQGKTKLIKIATPITNFLLKIGIDVRRKVYKAVIDGLGGALRLVIIGGAPADPKILKAFDDFGITTLQGYGLSETSPVVCAENAKLKKNGTCGHPMPSFEVEIVDKDEQGIGEIRAKGPCVMLGYYEMPEQTAEVLKDG
ncbi:MAG: AMP-binding protein, partial [Treponema sp.]|nr:AMP-binding protein [Treponema sp.]